MCPLCWATLLATFSLSVGVSALLIAGRDHWTLLAAGCLLALAVAHRFGAMIVPSSAFTGLIAIATGRVIWLTLMHRARSLLFVAWRRANTTTEMRCPNRRRVAMCTLQHHVDQRACAVSTGPPRMGSFSREPCP